MSRLKGLKCLGFLAGKLAWRRVQTWAVAYIAGTPNVEIFMFVIHTRVLDEKATVVSTGIADGRFDERQDAERHLDQLVERSQPNAGRDSNRCVWWIQEDKIVTVYTINP